MSDILHLDFDTQQPNKVLKGDPEYNYSGLYDFDTVDDMIKNQSYIPVVDEVEMEYFGSGGLKPMGAGTPWAGNYNISSSGKFILLSDLNFGTGEWTSKSIGGVFDGNGHTVTVDEPTQGYFLTSVSDGASFINTNVNIVNGYYASTNQALFCASFDGTVDNCVVDIVGEYRGTYGINLSGLFRSATGFGTFITNSKFKVNLTTTYTGFITISLMSHTPVELIENVHLDGTFTAIIGSTSVVGFTRVLSSGYTIRKCSAVLDIVGSSNGVCGIAYENYSTIEECFVGGSISAPGSVDYVAGLVCYNRSGATLRNSFSSAAVTGNPAESYIAGAVGRNQGTIDKCFSFGAVVGGSGFCDNNSGTVTDCYWDIDSSGQATSVAGIGKTTAEMKQGLLGAVDIYTTYSGTLWDAVDTNSYPELLNKPANISVVVVFNETAGQRNNIHQVTEKARNILFIAELGNEPTYNYGGWFDTNGTDNRGLKTARPIVIDFRKSFHIDFWFKPERLDVAGIEVLMRYGVGSIIFQTYFDRINKTFSSSFGSMNPSLYGIDINEGEWCNLYYEYIRELDAVAAYLNGHFMTTVAYNPTNRLPEDIFHYGRSFDLLNPNYGSLSTFKMDYGYKHYNGSFPVNGTKVFNPEFKPFNWYKRYREDGNKKLFFSSRYLEGANIEVDGSINSVKSEINSDVIFVGAIRANQPIYLVNQQANKFILDNGYKCTLTTPKELMATTLDNSSEFIYESTVFQEFFLGVHFKPITSNGNQFFCRYLIQDATNSNIILDFYFVYNFSGGLSKILYYDLTNFTYSEVTNTNNWCYLSTCYKGGLQYYFFNGKLVGSVALSAPTNPTQHKLTFQNTVGDALDTFVIDDSILDTKTSIINPTGYAIGEKVFQPPARRRLDTGRANNGLYSAAKVKELIEVDGYIPITNGDGFDSSIYATGTKKMGFGTEYYGDYVIGTDKKYIQLSDINETNPFQIAGFSGIYDGNGFSTTVERTGAQALAMFGSTVDGAEIRNVKAFGNRTGTLSYIGGIVGDCQGSTTIENCSYEGEVYGAGLVGGLIGRVLTSNPVIIRNCITRGLCDAEGNGVGGFIGQGGAGLLVEDCVNFCDVGTKVSVASGGVGGFISSLIGGTMNRCVNYGNVYSNVDAYYFGGMMADNNGGLVTDCVNYGNVDTGNLGKRVGGFAGRATGTNTLVNCLSVGTVNGASEVAGLIGNIFDTTIPINSYYDTTVSGLTDTDRGTPKTTTELKQGSIPDVSVFVGWDANVWAENTNSNYPSLKNMNFKKRLQEIR